MAKAKAAFTPDEDAVVPRKEPPPRTPITAWEDIPLKACPRVFNGPDGPPPQKPPPPVPRQSKPPPPMPTISRETTEAHASILERANNYRIRTIPIARFGNEIATARIGVPMSRDHYDAGIAAQIRTQIINRDPYDLSSAVIAAQMPVILAPAESDTDTDPDMPALAPPTPRTQWTPPWTPPWTTPPTSTTRFSSPDASDGASSHDASNETSSYDASNNAI